MSTAAATPPDSRFRAGPVVVVAAGHWVHDIYTSYFAPLLPLLIRKLGLTLTQAGALQLVFQIPALANPFLGAVADRARLRWLAIPAPAATAVTMSLIGVAPTFTALAVLLLFAGVSNSAWHVLGPVIVARASGDRVGRGMSFFMFGGELARSVGPLLAVGAVSLWGLEGIWRGIPVGFAASILLALRLPRTDAASFANRASDFAGTWRLVRRVMLPIAGIIAARAFLYASTATFLPTLLTSEGETLWFASGALSVFQFAGAAGVVASGTLSDRLGRRPVMLLVMIVSPFVMLLFLVVRGWLVLPVLVLLGALVVSTNPVLLALVQDEARDRPATANGMYMTLGFVIRSVVVVIVGAMADAWGLRTAFYVSAFVGFLGLPFAMLLPVRRPNPA